MRMFGFFDSNMYRIQKKNNALPFYQNIASVKKIEKKILNLNKKKNTHVYVKVVDKPYAKKGKLTVCVYIKVADKPKKSCVYIPPNSSAVAI